MRQALLAILLAGCASQPSIEWETKQFPAETSGPAAPPSSAVSEVERHYRSLARTLTEQGQLAEALARWEVLTLLRPDSSEYNLQLEDTRNQISAEVMERLRMAAQARRRGELDQAIVHYLRVLAVDPYHTGADQALRELDYDRDKRTFLTNQPRASVASRPGPRPSRSVAGPEPKSEGLELDLGIMLYRQGEFLASAQTLEKYAHKNARDPVVRFYLADAYQALGMKSLQQRRNKEALAYLEKAQVLGPRDVSALTSRVRTVRRALGDEYYRFGLQAYPSDLPGAISFWEHSLLYDPAHIQATVRLQQARRAVKTLRAIERSSATAIDLSLIRSSESGTFSPSPSGRGSGVRD